MNDGDTVCCPLCSPESGALPEIPVGLFYGLTCPLCSGTGRIPQDKEKDFIAGQQLRAYREDRDLGLREAADILAINPSDLSRLERGELPAEDFFKLFKRVFPSTLVAALQSQTLLGVINFCLLQWLFIRVFHVRNKPNSHFLHVGTGMLIGVVPITGFFGAYAFLPWNTTRTWLPGHDLLLELQVKRIATLANADKLEE